LLKKDWKTLLVKNWIEISDTYDYSIKNIIFLKEFNSFVYIKLNKNWNPYAWTIILLKSKNNNQTTTKTEETKIPTTDKSTYTKQLILSKNALNKSSKYKKYISQVDKLVLNLSKEKWEQVLAKIQKLKKKNDIIKYLEAKIYLQLNK
jgi:tetrahydrodipicolinate N-succinyltransferase